MCTKPLWRTLTRKVVPTRPHPPEALAVRRHIAQIAVRHDAGVQPNQAAALAAADAGQIEAGALAEHDVQAGGAHVRRAVQTVGDRVRAAACTRGRDGFEMAFFVCLNA